jgi:hypothetical protein
MMFDNTVLDEFDPDLRPALYKKDNGKPGAASSTDANGQGEISLPQQGVKLTTRKCMSIEMPIKLRKELLSWQVVYHRGASDASAIKAGDTKFTDFQLREACEGGSVLLRWKVYQKFQPEVQGYVDHMAQTEVECTFRAPEKKQADLVDQAQGQKAAAGSKKKSADPFAGSDLAKDDTKIASNKKKGGPQPDGSWPFPSGAAGAH